MSKKTNQNYNLPSLQERILLNLAQKGPQTRNEMKESVGSAYKNIIYSFKSLQEKGLIHKIGDKSYRGQKFPEFWLTREGIILSLLKDVSPDSLLKITKETLPDNKDTEQILFIIDASEILDRRLFEYLYFVLQREPEFTLRDVMLRILQAGTVDEMMKVLTEKDVKKQLEALFGLLNKYPKLREDRQGFIYGLKKMITTIEKMLRVVNHD